MPRLIRLSLVTLATAASVVAFGQSAGPAPLAWRWAQATSVKPGGTIAVDGDVIFAAVGRRVYALDRTSGNQIWRFPAAEPLDSNFRSGVLRSDDVIVAATDNKTLYGLDPAKGTQKWVYTARAGFIGSPIIAGKYVVLALSDSSLMAVNLSDGTAAWQTAQRIFDGIQGSMSAYQDNILLVTLSQELWSINVGSQNKNWSVRFSQLNGDVKPTVFGDVIYVNSGDFVTAIGAQDGRKRWQANAFMPLSRNPAVSADGVAVVSRDGDVMTYGLNGSPLLRKATNLGSVPIVDPTIIGGNVAVATSNGSLNLVDLKSGASNWNFIVRPMTPPVPKDDNDKPANYVTAANPPYLAGNSLLLMALDGSLLSFDRQFGVDLTGPELKMAYPAAGDQVKGAPPFEVFFSANDIASGVKESSIKVEVDGKAVVHTFNRDGYVIVKFDFDAKNKPLNDGRHVFTVTASDWMGNSTTKQFSLTVDSTLPDTRKRDNSNQPGGGRTGGPGAGGSGGGGNRADG